MRLGAFVLHLRSKSETFSGRIGGAAEFVLAREHSLRDEMAFVLPVGEESPRNQYDTSINQKITEQFAIVVAIKNDTNHQDKTGFIAYNRLHDIRQEMFEAFLGYDVKDILNDDSLTSESLIYYRGGQLLDFDRAYLWYQYTFEYQVGIEQQFKPDMSGVGWFDRIYAQYEIRDEYLPIDESLPVSSFSPSMEQLIDFTEESESRLWILHDGVWEDDGIWLDDERWND